MVGERANCGYQPAEQSSRHLARFGIYRTAMSSSRQQGLLIAGGQSLAGWLDSAQHQDLPFDVHAAATDSDPSEPWLPAPVDLVVLDGGLSPLQLDFLTLRVREHYPETRLAAVVPAGNDVDEDVHKRVDVWLERFPDSLQLQTLFIQTGPLRDRAATSLKVILGGEASVGKTSLMRYYATGLFEPERDMTIGVDFHIYSVEVQGENLRLIVWDIAGQGRFAPIRPLMYRGSSAVALVFDLHNRTSFYQLAMWWREVREQLGDIPVILLGNKADLERVVTLEEAETLASAWHTPYFETSCVDGRGVTEFFMALSAAALRHAQAHPPASKAITLDV
jgi:small GTP-binding protein